jgi:beta-1,4-mannosyl-glycoprotein beta-1,4-N-acetylglucosaminyltransferase
MIYDCFYFFDELDLLEIRLNILDSHVDKFILVEATETFNGKPKELNYKNNIDRFKQFNHKIIHHVVDNYPNDEKIYKKSLESPNTGNKEHWWVREFYQKECLINALESCIDNDLIFISDVDEIWNPELDYTFITDDKIYRPLQNAHPFYLNIKSDQSPNSWTGTRVGLIKTVKIHGPNHFRTENINKSIIIPNGGWHFSWLSKEPNKWKDNHPDNQNRFFQISNTNRWIDDESLPKYLKTNKEKYKHLFFNKDVLIS